MAEKWQLFRIRALLLLGLTTALGALTILLFPQILIHTMRASDEGTDPRRAIVVLLACAAPPFLARLCYGLINRKSAAQHLTLRVPANLDPTIVDRVLASWNYELCRSHWHLSRAECFSAIWGLVTTVILVGAAVFLLPPTFHAANTPYQGRANMIAFAVVGAASVRFLLDLTAVCVRVANDDATKRMFAEALRSMVLSVVATLAFVLVPALFGAAGPFPMQSDGNGSDGTSSPILGAIGIGAGIAVLGIPVFQLVVERLAMAVGMKKPEAPRGTPLTSIAGIGDPEITRLGEEGISSLEALVNTPLARLFLGTRFSLQRLCDWIDKGILICRVGSAGAEQLRTRAGIDGALDIYRISQLAPDKLGPRIKAIKEALRLDSEDQGQGLVDSLRHCDGVILADAFRQMVPVNVDTSFAQDGVVTRDRAESGARPPSLALPRQ